MSVNWTTEDELSFLSKLGTQRYLNVDGPIPPRLELLLKYRHAARHYRHDWGQMSRGRVLDELARMIEVERLKVGR